ncbi:adhesion G protein-coupled receptor E5-like isoform X2 [Clarias gariepinus]|uniref:adhesion G protein-coupled receptor E5-like isoform X2 n=1 Tax=Clarias gariepinus TaxID=13013 RepID=UPI00234C880B|nr:adhesion G protein-coupled receptor E5-like isoform X2 [Clarias gariepinus]
MIFLKMASLLCLILLLLITGALGNEWSVTYSQGHLCALNRSTVFLNVSYTHPTRLTVMESFWLIDPVKDTQETDLRNDLGYSGRVAYLGDGQKHVFLRLSDVKKTDEHMYCFRIRTNEEKEAWLAYPGVTLTVTDLQVIAPAEVTEGQSALLICKTTCSLTDPTFIWYKNSRDLTTTTVKSNEVHLQSVSSEDAGSYSCAVRGYEHLPSPAHTLRVRYVNKCDLMPPVCGPHGVCINTNGSFVCSCSTGFRNQGQSNTTCEDIDECYGDQHVCGQGGNCSNSEGSYLCQCTSGYSNYGNNQAKCTELKCYNTSKNVGTVMDGLLDLFTTSCGSLSGSSMERRSGETLLQNLLNVTGGVLSGGNLNSSSTLSVFFGAVENTMRLIAPQLNKNTTRMDNEDTEAWLTVRKDLTPPTGSVTLVTDNVQLNTSWETAVGANYPGFAYVALVSYKSLNSTKVSPPVKTGAETSHINTTYLLNSEVVTALISNTDTHSLPEPVTLTFRHKNEREVSKGLNYSCVYWAGDEGGGTWSGDGCVKAVFNSTHAVCKWEHLSSFAVLMALYPIEDTFELVWITRVGLTISIICLFFCILTFLLCRSIHGTRTTIHLHLCVCLFIANIIFLFFITSTENKVGCASVAALLHFFYLAAFCFMLLEGVQLYRMLVLVFHITLHPMYLYAVGYGIPLVIVVISAIAFLSGYGTERHCWLSLEQGFIWSFFAPVCIIVLLNSFFFVITVWKLVRKFSSLNPDVSKLKRIRGFVLTAVAQLCVLGGMWIFGCFLFQEQGTLVMAYLFTLFNSLQGALIFIMHCLMSKQVREEYRKLYGRVCKSEKKKYSDDSTNQSSSSRRPLKSIQSTGESQI